MIAYLRPDHSKTHTHKGHCLKKHEKDQQQAVGVVALLSQSVVLCVWMIERGSVVVATSPVVCELMTGNEADASCLTD